MELTRQCKEDFEKWYFTEKANKSVMLYSKREFLDLTPSMQYGVYVDFFDSVGVEIDFYPTYGKELFSTFIVTSKCIESDGTYKTRQEAREQAITKANELYNARTTL